MNEESDLYACKRELRKLFERYPAAFETIVAEFRSGSENSWRSYLPPMKSIDGKPIQVGEGTLALMLADYRIAKNQGQKRKDYLRQAAADGCRYGTPYFRGKWRSVKTIDYYLKRATKLARNDDSFRDEVTFFERALVEVRAARALKRLGENPDTN